MDATNDGKRKKTQGEDDNDRRREKRSKRARTRSRSPVERRERDSQRKRRRSRSRSPYASVKHEQEKKSTKEADVKAEASARRTKETDMLNTRTGGAYIPPARLRMMQAQITDKSSVAYQRLAWEALKKSIHGHINKINIGNIGIIIKELLQENIVRGRGLLCRSIIQAQAASPTFTNVYAALVAAVNSRFPNIGELLLKRLVIQFKRGFKRNDKTICISSASFIAHLVNQRVAHEILALELLTLLVETPTDDSVEVAISFMKECGQKLTEVSSKGVNAIFEMLRNILHEGQLDKRVQYMIEVMFQVWKDGFKDHPALIEELELVPEEEQFTHLLMLDDGTDPQDILNVFKFDEKYEDNEQKYKTLSKEILGSDAESGDEDGSGESGSDESDDDDDGQDGEQKGMTIIDNTETNLVALRRTIYLTINSSLDFEECAHKLMKMELKPGQEVELCHMFLDCCAEQRTYEKFYGLLAQRFCNINRIYIGPFEDIFKDSYSTAHRLDTNRLRNVSKFFAHLLFTDSISWEVLECVKLNEEDTTSSSRIYIKILFQELAEYMGLKKLNDRLKDPTLQSAFSGVFPRDNPKNTRFSINFFTSIGLGGLTDELREHLKQMPKNVPPPAEITVGSSSDSSSSSSSSSDSSSDSSSSDSEEEKEKSKKKKDKKKSKDKTPKTPENDEADKNKNAERWGHDGFYDTYGKDAQRYEPRNERDKDNFAIPRGVPKRREQRNGDDRRRNEEEDPRYRRHDDDERRDRERKERNNENRDHEENYGGRRNRDAERQDRSSRDERNRDRDNYKRDRYESERDSGYESRSKRQNDYDDRHDREKSRRDDRRDRDNTEYRREKNSENGTDGDEHGHSKGKRNDDDDNNKREKERANRDDRKDSSREEPNEGSKSKRHTNKDNESTKKKKKQSKERQKDSDESSEEESSRSHKRDKNRSKDDSYESKSKRKGSKRDKENSDGWDIRGTSVIKEFPAPNRFWNTYDDRTRESGVERSPEGGTPEKLERSKDRRDR